jgi:hypothetical protein
VALQVTCNGCGASTTITCRCHPAVLARGHHGPLCPVGDPHAALSCRPGFGCCPQAHDHAAACDSCTGAHQGPCRVGVLGCAVCRSLTITALPGSAQLHGLSGG